MLLLLFTLLGHRAFKLFVMLVDLHLLKLEHVVTLGELAIILLGLHLPVHLLVTVAVNLAVKAANLS